MGELRLIESEAAAGVGPLAVGAAGEYRVASELLLRGFMPMIAAVDMGVDIVLQDGPTIQVKTSMKPRVQRGGAANYAFRFATFSKAQGKRQRMLADFAVCWGVADDLFWIVPQAAIGDREMVHIPMGPRVRQRNLPTLFERYQGAWEALR